MQSRARVLIIDDDAMFRNLLMTHLRKDYVVAVATDGKDGYHKAKSHKPDVVIIDIQMPEWDGIQTLKAFRENPILKDVNAIMLTADNTRETVMAAIKSGAQEYMIKNVFKKEELLAKVNKLASGNVLQMAAPQENHASARAGHTQPAKKVELHPESQPAQEPNLVAASSGNAQLAGVLDNWE